MPRPCGVVFTFAAKTTGDHETGVPRACRVDSHVCFWPMRSFASKVDFDRKRVSCLVRVTSWIVPFVQKNKDDPRSYTNQHETKILPT